jgi:crotonobetainyl-CoA:carnitine CoA-transferase CaiB-like acyl-CoA transferase
MAPQPPFRHLRVVEWAGVLAGPAVGQFFAELGAEVLKIEPPAGDGTRAWRTATETPDAGVTAYFSAVNWGKQSVVLNLETPAHLQQLVQWLAEADVLICNQKASTLRRFGLDFTDPASDFRQRFPRLLVGHIVGYEGSDRLGYDAVVQAEGGFMYLNGEPDGLPTKLPVALMDLLAAHQLKEGLLLALWNRERTGQGDVVTASLFGSAVASLVNQAASWLWAAEAPARTGSDHPSIAPYGTVFFDAENLPLLLAVGNDRQFADLCQVLALPHLPADPRFATNPARVQHREALHERLRQAIGATHREALLNQLHRAGVPAGAVRSVPDVCSRPETAPYLLPDAQQRPRGLRTVAFRTQQTSVMDTLSEPPPLPQSGNSAPSNGELAAYNLYRP